jgi:hypothetical protein
MNIRILVALYLVSGNTHSVDKILIQSVHVDPGGSVHIIESDGHEREIPKEKEQVGSSQAKITDDKETAGWLSEYENCCTSYPIPLTLVVYRRDKELRRFGDGMMIYDWRFWVGGRQVAFCSGTVHGDSGGHCELHDVQSGRALEVINGHLDDHSPKWAKGLNN